MANELKPCPFCGKNPITEVRVTQCGGDFDIVAFSIVCEECRTCKTAYLRINNKDKANFNDVDIAIDTAIKAWNRREGKESWPINE